VKVDGRDKPKLEIAYETPVEPLEAKEEDELQLPADKGDKEEVTAEQGETERVGMKRKPVGSLAQLGWRARPPVRKAPEGWQDVWDRIVRFRADHQVRPQQCRACTRVSCLVSTDTDSVTSCASPCRRRWTRWDVDRWRIGRPRPRYSDSKRCWVSCCQGCTSPPCSAPSAVTKRARALTACCGGDRSQTRDQATAKAMRQLQSGLTGGVSVSLACSSFHGCSSESD
jgi:hypothetical protein